MVRLTSKWTPTIHPNSTQFSCLHPFKQVIGPTVCQWHALMTPFRTKRLGAVVVTPIRAILRSDLIAVPNAAGPLPKGRFRATSQQVARRAHGQKWCKYVMFQYFSICFNQCFPNLVESVDVLFRSAPVEGLQFSSDGWGLALRLCHSLNVCCNMYQPVLFKRNTELTNHRSHNNSGKSMHVSGFLVDVNSPLNS